MSKANPPTVCAYYLRNACTRGSFCHYSHASTNTGAPMPSTKEPCSHFLRGTCRFGDQCVKSHDNSPSTCKFFLAGICKNGSQCSFRHPEAAIPSEQSSGLRCQMGARLSKPPKAFGACEFYLKGQCKNGSLCSFGHPVPARPPPSALPPGGEHAGAKIAPACHFYLKGACKKGSTCSYPHPRRRDADETHSTPKDVTANILQPGHIDKKINPPDTNHNTPGHGVHAHAIGHTATETAGDIFPDTLHTTTTRCVLNCEVLFGAGGSTIQIMTPFDSRHVILSNFPNSVTMEDLIDLTRPIGGLVTSNLSEGTSTARLQFENCHQAAQAVQYLNERAYRSTKLAARLDLRAAVESGSGTLLSRKVRLSWFAPSRIAWAQYPSISTAQQRASELTGRSFNGRTISVSLQKSTARVGRRIVHRSSSSIEIKGLPLRLNDRDLERFTRSKSVTFGPASYELDDALIDIRKLLERSGVVESFDLLPAGHGKPKVTAFAQFSSSDAAAEVVKKIHNTPQEFLRHSRLWVEQIHAIKYSISFQHFTSIKAELDRLRDEHGVDAKLRYYDSDVDGKPANPVYIRIYGTNPKRLGQLKMDLEPLLRGENYMVGEEVFWDEYFESEEGKQFILQMNAAESNHFVKCDPRTRALRICGHRNARQLAEQLLDRQVEAVKASRHHLSVGKDMLRGLLQGGLKTLEGEIGVDKIVLDVVAMTLSVQGDDEDVRKARRIIASSGTVSPSLARTTVSEELCPVCFCDLTDPIALSCGHSYCLTCLQHLLRSHTGSNFTSVICVAEAVSTCGTHIPYPTIRELLQPAEEAALLEASLLSYIHSRPTEFRYCPTPDCKVIYRPQERGVVLQCPECLARICASCHVEYHEGMTCAEHFDHRNGGLEALRKWKRENGVKECPECHADLEKNGGCNHIKCIRCGTHMCWVCMKTFPPEGVYEHMRRAHGGIGN